jgi:hypothetical protein
VGIEECVVNDLVSPPAGAPLFSATWDIGGFRHEELDHSPKAGHIGWGRHVSMDFAQRDPNILVRLFEAKAGDKGGGGSYSLDNGRTWTSFAANSGGDGSAALSADGKTIVVTNAAGLQRWSRDYGATWTDCQGIAPKAAVVSDRTNPDRFYAFAWGVAYLSTDGGKSFAGRPIQDVGDGFLRAAPGSEGHLWLAGEGGLFRSTDGGQTFTKIPAIARAFRIGFGKPAEGKSYPALYLIGDIGAVHGFFRSDDEGATWVRINDDQHQYGSVNCITGDPRVYGRVYIGSSNRGVQYGEPAGR